MSTWPGSDFSKAIFVPSISTYSKVTSGASDIPLFIPSKDLAWQFKLQRVWERLIHGRGLFVLFYVFLIIKGISNGGDQLNDFLKLVYICHADTGQNNNLTMESLPPSKFLYDDISNCNPENGKFSCSAVFPSLPLAVSWLRNSSRDNPKLRLQVMF